VGQGKQPETSSAPEGPDIIYYSASDRMAAIIMAGLVQCNYRAEFANSSYLAIIKAAQLLPRLVIVDINNPGSKGFSIVAALRKSSRTQHIPVVLMLPAAPAALLDTLKKTYWDSQMLENAGDIAILRYPFSFAELIKTVACILSK
jgi:CheY-like chemotaxis protein